MNQQAIEDLIAEFEQRLLAGDDPDILEFADPGDPNLAILFDELLHTDLELRLRLGQGKKVEDYVNRFPELQERQDLLTELLKTEYKVRSKFEPGLRLQEFADRFPQLYQALPTASRFSHSTVASSSENYSTHDVEQSCSDFSSRFRKKQLYKQGGLGNIWLAFDRELNRTVVIKEIKEKFNHSAAHRARFKREQVITSKLDHPGIASIYGVGHFADGSPYFAMQFIDGSTMTDAVDRFHRRSHVSRVDRQLEFRRLLQHFIDACNTIDYAHSQNIVHRDIKPSNIMIGQFGETFVVDWGLAKFENDPAVFQQPTDDKSQLEKQNNGFSIAGQSIGSPGYMSPEQRSGNVAAMNARSDVYGLGATLWKIATNTHPPAPIADVDDIKIVDLSIIQPLISISTKAMSALPHDRYASAKELSEDVQRYLSDESVKAHSYSTLDRLHRFTRKYNEVVSAASIAGLFLTVILAIAAVWINYERQAAVLAKESESVALRTSETARNAEALARKRAEERTQQLTHTYQLFADLFAGSDDSNLFLPLQTTTLGDALDKLKLQIGDYDSHIQSMLFNIFARNNKGHGNFNLAIEQYQQSIDLLQQNNIPSNDPLHLDVLIGLAFTHLYAGNLNESIALKEQIISILSSLPFENSLQHFKSKLLSSRLNLNQGNSNEAISEIHEAIDLANKIYNDTPDHNNILWAKYRLASIYSSTGAQDKAVSIFSEIQSAFENKSERHPLEISSSVQMGLVDYGKGKVDAAIETIEKSLNDAREILGNEHPDCVVINSRLATLLALHTDPGKRQRGLNELEKCRTFQMKHLGLLHPNTMVTNCMLANALVKSGDGEQVERAAEITAEFFTGDPPKIIEATQIHEKVATSLASAFAFSSIKTGNVREALKQLNNADHATELDAFKSSINQLEQHLQSKEEQAEHNSTGNQNQQTEADNILDTQTSNCQ